MKRSQFSGLTLALCGLLILAAPHATSAQIAAGGGFGGGNLGGGLGGGIGGGGLGGGGIAGGGIAGAGGGVAGAGGGVGGGVAGAAAGGILIDAKGVVRPVFQPAKAVALHKKRMNAAAGKFLSGDVNKPSKRRKVSLVRLERELEKYIKDKKDLPADLNYLAGLQRIDYVFVYPETGDIVVAGPAEGFAPNAVGRVVGLTSGRPTLRLDDLVVALRALERAGTIGCSIDPVKERLADLQRYLARNSTAATPNVVRARYGQMSRILGAQDVRVWGVPSDTHFAQALVEADYRMKLVSMGLERVVGVRGFRSHLAMLAPGGNSMQRWWFTPLYDAFYTTADGNAFQFAGQRAQLQSQEEVSDATGTRRDAANTRLSTKKYAKLFTEKFPELAEKNESFAELQNLMDVSILAALLKRKRLPQRVNWKMSTLLDASKLKTVTGYVPKEVYSGFNVKRVGRRLMLGLVGGGVTMNPMQTVRNIEFKVSPRKGVGDAYKASAISQPPEAHPWWWD